MNPARPKILFIGYIWPEPQSSAAGLRSMSLIRIFRDAGWEVHFASPANASSPESLGVITRAIAPNDPGFDKWIAALAPQVVLFERFMMEEQFGWRVSEHSPRSLLMLDTVDLHFLRQARQEALRKAGTHTPLRAPLSASQALPGLPGLPGLSELENDAALREIASIYRCDLSLLISEIEHEWLRDPRGPFRVPPEILRELGFCYDPPPAPRADLDRAHFIFIGCFRHEPNADAVRWLKREIWPGIRRKLPNARIDVHGAYPPRELMRLGDASQGFEMKGPVADQFEALASHLVNLAPLRFGAGLKGKISDGWRMGTPCVSTSVGAEGMKLGERFGGLIADTPEAFAAAACALHENASLREETRATGYETLSRKFDHARNASRLLEEIESVRARLDGHRQGNFTGRMLSHHLHRSTKYFSRWIEAKNSLPSPHVHPAHTQPPAHADNFSK